MSKKDKIQMPQTSAGLVRYYDDSKAAIKIRPEFVVAATAALFGIVLFLRLTSGLI